MLIVYPIRYHESQYDYMLKTIKLIDEEKKNLVIKGAV